MGARVHTTDLAINQGCRPVFTGLPPRRRRGQRSNFRGGARWRDGYHFCGDREGAAGPGCAKTSSLGRKTFQGPSQGGAIGEGVETSGSENKTRLVAAGTPGRGSSGRPRAARLGVCCRAGLEAADANYLVSVPDLDGEGVGSKTQYSVGAVVEGL